MKRVERGATVATSRARLRSMFRLGLVLLVIVPTSVFAVRSLLDVQARRLLAQGRDALALGHYASGLELAERALWLQPDSPEASLVAARCLARLGRDDEADLHFRRAGALALEDREARARALLEAGRTTRAIPELQEVLRLDPRNPDAARSLAAIHHERGEYKLAEELARRLAADPATELIGQALLGTIHHDLAARKVETPAAAIRAFERMLELDPDLVRCPIQPRRLFWYFLAHDLIAEGRADDAQKHLRRALSQGEDAGLLELMGQAHLSEGRVEEARRCWERAAALDPTRSDPWINLGQLALRQNRAEDAVRFLSRSLELSPNSAKPLYALIQAHRRLGQSREADELQKRLDALNHPGRRETEQVP